MLTQAPIGSIIMLADGAGSATPQYGGSYELFAKVFTNGVIIQPSSSLIIQPSASLIIQTGSSLNVNGYLTDKVVQHRYTVIGNSAPSTTYIQTQQQWNVTGSYVLYTGTSGHTIYIAPPDVNQTGLTFNLQRYGGTTGTTLRIDSSPDYIYGNINGFDQGATGIQVTKATGNDYSSIELVWINDIDAWLVKSHTGLDWA